MMKSPWLGEWRSPEWREGWVKVKKGYGQIPQRRVGSDGNRSRHSDPSQTKNLIPTKSQEGRIRMGP
jgi:hypothetical protein